MDLIPAIDLRSGKCVRLLQGDYDRQVNYQDDPLEVVRRFEQAGARWLHVVDLDGAREGRPCNIETIHAIAAGTRLNVEVGGGIRDDATVEELLATGVARTVIGTQALRDWAWFEALVHRPAHHHRIVLGLDARDGRLAVQGWTEQTDQTASEVAERVADWPLSAIVYTDIARDGMLSGPNVEAVGQLARVSKVPVVASGGVTTLDDVRRLVELPIEGMIVGRAIYEGQFDLDEAIRIVNGA